MKINIHIILFAFILSTFWSCKKEPGPQGEPGINGSIILSDSGSPSANIGKDGDFYLDQQSAIFYGPKTGGSWNTSVHLRGAEGEGGKDGLAGISVLNGEDEPTLTIGKPGDFYINIKTRELYGHKTASTWGKPILLQGAKGESVTQGLKVIYYKNLSMDGIDNDSILSIIPENYEEINETGLIFAYLRDNAPENQNLSWRSEASINIFPDEIIYKLYLTLKPTRQSIDISIYYHVYDWYKEMLADFTKTFRYDIKIIMISVNDVEYMKAQNININNIKEVEKFLGLHL